jgi:hypothetical protein
LLAAFPPPKQERGNIPTERSGIVEAMISELGRDRSGTFFDAIKAAHAADTTPDDRNHPNGFASMGVLLAGRNGLRVRTTRNPRFGLRYGMRRRHVYVCCGRV